MNKFYLLVVFTVITLTSQAQAGKGGYNSFTSEAGSVKVLRFYPNPATTVINFELLKDFQKDYTLQVYNFVGKKVYELNRVNQKTIIPLSEFFRGVYIYQLRDKTGRIVESGKFQVSK